MYYKPVKYILGDRQYPCNVSHLFLFLSLFLTSLPIWYTGTVCTCTPTYMHIYTSTEPLNLQSYWITIYTCTCTPFSLECVNSTRECICTLNCGFYYTCVHACITGHLVKVSTLWIMMALGWYVCAASIITDYPPTLQCSIPLILSQPSTIHVWHARTCLCKPLHVHIHVHICVHIWADYYIYMNMNVYMYMYMLHMCHLKFPLHKHIQGTYMSLFTYSSL